MYTLFMNVSSSIPCPFVVLEFEELDQYKMRWVPEWLHKPLRGKVSTHAIIVIMLARVARWASWNVAAVAET